MMTSKAEQPSLFSLFKTERYLPWFNSHSESISALHARYNLQPLAADEFRNFGLEDRLFEITDVAPTDVVP